MVRVKVKVRVRSRVRSRVRVRSRDKVMASPIPGCRLQLVTKLSIRESHLTTK